MKQMKARIVVQLEKIVDFDWDNIHGFDSLWFQVGEEMKQLADKHNRLGYRYFSGSIGRSDG